MAKILLQLYGERHKKSKAAVIKMANRGSFNTAEKIGRQWFIEEDEEYPDLRVKSGKYVGKPRARKSKDQPKTDI